MPHPPRPAAARAVDDLLRDLGPRLRRGGVPEAPAGRFATGITDIDRLLGGGFPRGRLSEIAGAPSSGRTSLALALLAGATRAGESCAVVDAADGFDPRAAASAGVALPRVLWVRAPGLRETLLASERVLEAEGFGLLLLNATGREAPSADFMRLARKASETQTALVALSLERTAGTAAAVALEMEPARAHFTGTPPLLEAVDVVAHLVRHRSAPTGRSVRVRLRAS